MSADFEWSNRTAAKSIANNIILKSIDPPKEYQRRNISWRSTFIQINKADPKYHRHWLMWVFYVFFFLYLLNIYLLIWFKKRKQKKNIHTILSSRHFIGIKAKENVIRDHRWSRNLYAKYKNWNMNFNKRNAIQKKKNHNENRSIKCSTFRETRARAWFRMSQSILGLLH